MTTYRTVRSIGRTGETLWVEAAVTRGLPRFAVVGNRGRRDRELRDRLRAAILVAGFEWPQMSVTVNLLDSDAQPLMTVDHWWSGLDLPAAAAILAVTGQVDDTAWLGVPCIGELNLDGTVRHAPIRTASKLDVVEYANA